MNQGNKRSDAEEWKEITASENPDQLARARRILLKQYPRFKEWLREEAGIATKFFQDRSAFACTNEIENQIHDASYSHFTWQRSGRWRVRLKPVRAILGKLQVVDDAVALDFTVDSSRGIRAIDPENLDGSSLTRTLAVENPFTALIEIDCRASWAEIEAFIRPRWEISRGRHGIRTGKGKQQGYEIDAPDLDVFKLWLCGDEVATKEKILAMYKANDRNKKESSLLDDFRKRGPAIRKFVDPLNISSAWILPDK